jgi:hypothetical protein
MEFNGLHNMVIKIRTLAEQGKVPQEEADKLLAEATLFEKYLLAFHLNKETEVKWHEVRDNPSKYQTLAEHQREFFDKIKAERGY